MIEILRMHGILEEVVDVYKFMYTDSTSTLMTKDEQTQLFFKLAGILQGDRLAPFCCLNYGCELYMSLHYH